MPRLDRDEIWNLRLKDARPEILVVLSKEIYAEGELRNLLEMHRSEWRLPSRMSGAFFIEYLVRSRVLHAIELERDVSVSAPSYSDKRALFSRPNTSWLTIALSIRSNSFLSHLSAAYVHGLTDLVPKTVYTTKEQSPKNPRPSSPMEQAAIAQAFAKPARPTGLRYASKDGHEVVLLTSKYTGDAEVLPSVSAPNNEGVHPATSVERTLIECAIRPVHAGGIHEVRNIYEAARDLVSLKRLRKVLDEMDFVYPYRQAIGFLLERSGYPEARLQAFFEPLFEYDFYLDYALEDPEYCSRWRIYYPRGF